MIKVVLTYILLDFKQLQVKFDWLINYNISSLSTKKEMVSKMFSSLFDRRYNIIGSYSRVVSCLGNI